MNSKKYTTKEVQISVFDYQELYCKFLNSCEYLLYVFGKLAENI